MSKSSFHVDSKNEGAVIALLEDAGFEVDVGSSPMVDWTVTRDD